MSEYGKGRVYKRADSRLWWVEYWVAGVHHRESSGSDEKHVAEALLKRRIAEKQAFLHGLTDFAGPQRVTVEELLEGLLMDYRVRGRKSLADTAYHVRALQAYFGDMLAANVTPQVLQRYVAHRLDVGRLNATINRELSALRRAFNLAAIDGQVRNVPRFPMLPEHNVRRGFFEAHEVTLVIRALPDYLQDLTLFAYLTGWRRGEILSLQWDMVNLADKLIILPTTKNAHGRVLALEGDLWKVIVWRLADRRGSPWVFHRYGQRINGFRKAWATACQMAGLPGRHFHDLRRSAVRNLTRAGVPEKIAMDMTGHKTRSIYDRYNITNEADLRDAARRVQEYLQRNQ